MTHPREYWQHNKNKETYNLIGYATGKTDLFEGVELVVYSHDGSLYVRTKDNFINSFTRLVESIDIGELDEKAASAAWDYVAKKHGRGKERVYPTPERLAEIDAEIAHIREGKAKIQELEDQIKQLKTQYEL